jgi:hypothetical protein
MVKPDPALGAIKVCAGEFSQPRRGNLLGSLLEEFKSLLDAVIGAAGNP